MEDGIYISKEAHLKHECVASSWAFVFIQSKK